MSKSFCYLDTETTGLNQTGTDEIVEIAIVGPKGETLLNTLVKPVNHTEWSEAEAIHGISPDMVKDAPTLDDIKEKIIKCTLDSNLVIYNARYDVSFFNDSDGNWLVKAVDNNIECCMLAYARFYGDYNDYHQSFRWQKLINAAQQIGYEFEGAAHRAKADSLACRAVWLHMLEYSQQNYSTNHVIQNPDISTKFVNCPVCDSSQLRFFEPYNQHYALLDNERLIKTDNSEQLFSCKNCGEFGTFKKNSKQ